jgi:dihydrolipoamide dehydrogenase
MMAHKDATVKSNVDGVAFLMKKNKIDVLVGTGKDRRRRQGRGHARDGKHQDWRPRTSSSPPVPTSPAFPASLDIDEKIIVSSTGALALDKVPEASGRRRRWRDRPRTRLGLDAASARR